MKTYAIILISLIFLGIGEILAAKTFKDKKTKLLKVFAQNDIARHESDGILLSRVALTICFLFGIVTTVVYLIEVRNVVINSEYAQSQYGQVYSFLRQFSWAKILEGAQVAYYAQQMFTLSEVIAFVLTYVVIYNKVYVNGKVKNHPLAYITIIVYITTSFLTSGRSLMLNYFIYVFFVWVILKSKKNNWTFRTNLGLFFRALIIIIVSLLLFFIAGMLTGKTYEYDSPLDNFANYFSSSIYALNEYIKNPSAFESNSNFFGIHTLSGIYSFLRTLGFPIPDSIVPLEYIQCGDYLTNIYTPLRRYYQDFGWIGLCVIMFLVGYFYKRLIWKNKRKSSCGLDVIFAAYFIFPLVYMSIEERVFMDVIMMRSVYQIIYFILIYQWLINRKLYTVRVKLAPA